jgi:type-2 restriction enzyme nspV
LSKKYDLEIGNSAKGIDLPGENINTDIKVTSVKQPQSSCSFKSAR